MFSVRHAIAATAVSSALGLGIMGCQPDHPDLIPTGATMMQSGNGSVHFVTPDDGTVYVFDHQTNKLVWSGDVSKGKSVDINPQKQQLTVDGRIAVNNAISPTDVNDIYFQASPTPPAPPVVAPVPAPVAAPPTSSSDPSLNGGITVTPSVNIQQNPASGGNAASVTVQPGLNVSPTTQPSTGSPQTPSTVSPQPTPLPQP